MFPPVDEAVLRDNPDFAKLYQKLTYSVLNPDGSTRHDPDAEDQAAVCKHLDDYRLKAAKQHILTTAITTASNLPDSLLDLLTILPALLSTTHPISPATASLLLSNPPLSELDTLLPELSQTISSHLHSTALNLTRITRPNTNAYLHRYIPSLPRDLTTLRSNLADAQATLSNSRLRTLSSLTELLQSYSDAALQLINCLEAKHGPVAQSMELRAAEVAVKAQMTEGQAGEAMETLRRDIYSPEVLSALTSYLAHLRDAKTRAAERVKNVERDLERYGVGGEEGKEKMMREMARMHREIGRQVDEVTRDLKRLETS